MKLFYFIPDFFTAYDYKERWKNFLRTLRDFGASGFRVFLQYSWPPYEIKKANVLSPYEQIGFWNAGYSEAPLIPFYDATIFNEHWLEKLYFLKEFLLNKWPECQVILTLHDYTSIKQDGWKKYFYPFLSSSPDRDPRNPNINRYPYGFWGLDSIDRWKTVWFLHEAYIKKVMENFSEIDFLIEFCNEDEVPGWPDSYAHEYYKQVKKIIGDRLLISGRWASIQFGTFYSQHGIIRPIDPNHLPPVEKNYLILSGDGGVGGDGPADQAGKRGLGESMIYPLVKWLQNMNFYAYEFMDRGIWKKDNNRATLADADFGLFKKLSKEMGLYKEPEVPRIKMEVCSESGLIPNRCCPLRVKEEFYVGDEPREICWIHFPVNLDICLKSNKIATHWCRDIKHVNCSYEVLNYDLCDKCKPPCSFYFKKKNFKRWLQCILKI